ncbi:MAG: beta-lactamase family protein [Planctomycetales bacterium]|nr:beta-lactamase family protein [Planctomycetales bacterium]
MNRFMSCVVVCCLSSPLIAAQPEPLQQSAPPVLPAVTSAMQKFVDDGTVSGVVTLVARNGKIVHLQALGASDLESGTPMKNGTLFSIASMTKPIVATALMILVDEGKVSLDDPVSKYLPKFADAKLGGGVALSRPLTIKDLMTHTSGLGGNQVFSGTLAAEADRLAARPLDFQPGTKWQYSPGLNVVGRIIEVIAEQPLQDFLQQRIFDPLQMKHTTFSPGGGEQRRMATLYRKDAEGQLEEVENFIRDKTDQNVPNPSGGLVSNARDLYRFYRAVLNGGRFKQQQVVSAQSVKQMTAVQTGELSTGFTPGNGWGLGWCVVREPQGVTKDVSPGTFGHGGAFGTQGWVDPVSRTIYVLLIQRSDLPNSDASDLRAALHAAAQSR